MQCHILFSFFSRIWRRQNLWSMVELLRTCSLYKQPDWAMVSGMWLDSFWIQFTYLLTFLLHGAGSFL